MRRIFLVLFSVLMLALPAAAEESPPAPAAAPTMAGLGEGQIEITADQSLEWYQDKHLYVARGNARAVRGNMTVEADVLTAHEREQPAPSGGAKAPKDMPGGGNIDLLIAEGHVHITDPRQQVFGDRAEYDLDNRTARITGKNLKYVTDKDTVTARDSLEYYEDKNMAVARGKAVAIHDQRRVEADVLRALFAPGPNGEMEMTDMTAEGHVTVLTGNDITRGDRAVYDIKRNMASMTGNVRVTRDNTQLSGDRAEVDFTKGESRLVNEGHGRVRALLVPKGEEGKAVKPGAKAPAAARMDTGGEISEKTGSKLLTP